MNNEDFPFYAVIYQNLGRFRHVNYYKSTVRLLQRPGEHYRPMVSDFNVIHQMRYVTIIITVYEENDMECLHNYWNSATPVNLKIIFSITCPPIQKNKFSNTILT
jgi:hypothetical protein